MNKPLLRAVLATSLLAGGGALAGLTTGNSQLTSAVTCPNSSLSTVASSSGGPGYNYTRGCIVSFDGTPIVYNLFEPLDASSSNHVYTILEGPGWGGAGATTPDENLIADDYAELTWDPRGFGESGGVAEVDSPSAEGRDVSALIDDVLTGRPEIATDTSGAKGQPHYLNDSPSSNSHGQPVVGMTGVSYGGGIEFATAAFDKRVKAIAPGWAWNNLDYSLFPGDVVKLGWDELLFGAGLAGTTSSHLQGDLGGAPSTLGGTGGIQTGGYDPNIYYAEAQGTATGYPDGQTRAWFAQRSMAVYGAGPAGHVPQIPTLMIQGTVDTLFNLNDAWDNYEQITAADPAVPVKMIAFCGGHVSCPTGAAPTGANYNDTASSASPIGAGESAGTLTENQTIDWFDHYLRGKTESDGMPANVVYQTQDGNFHGVTTFPTYADRGQATYQATTIPTGDIVSTGLPGNPSTVLGEDTAVTDGPSPAGDPSTLTVPLSDVTGGLVVGEPHILLNVTVQGSGANLYFNLVDGTTGQIIDFQTTSLRLDNLDLVDNGANPNPTGQYSVSLDMNGVAYAVGNDQLELQITTASTSYANFRGAALVAINSGTLEVPTVS